MRAGIQHLNVGAAQCEARGDLAQIYPEASGRQDGECQMLVRYGNARSKPLPSARRSGINGSGYAIIESSNSM